MRPPRLFKFAVPLFAAFALGACGDDTTAPRPQLRLPAAPTAMLNDGSKAGGNPDFFFLPPVVPNPANDPDYSPGEFAGGWRPVVNVCEVNASNLSAGCISGTVKTYSGAAVSTADQQYQLQVDTKEPWAVAGKTYRFTVVVTGKTPVALGFVDIALLSGAAKNAGTGDLVTMQDGRTIPLKFRIEKGATVGTDALLFTETVVNDAAGATILTGGTGGPGTFALVLPPDFLPPELDQVVITVEKLSIGAGAECTATVPNLIQTSDCWRINSYPTIPRLTQDVTVAFCPAITPSDYRYEAQSLYKYHAPTLQVLENVPTTLVNCTPSEIGAAPRQPGVLGAIQYGLASIGRGLSKAFGPNTAYAIDLGWGGRMPSSDISSEDGVFSDFFWAVPLRIDVASSVPTSTNVGAGIPVTVRVTGAHVHADEEDAPIAIANVTVTPSGLVNAGISPATATTDANGEATFTVTPTAAGAFSASFGVTSVGSNTAVTVNGTATSPVAVSSIDLVTGSLSAGPVPYTRLSLSAIVGAGFTLTAIPRDASGAAVATTCSWSTTATAFDIFDGGTGTNTRSIVGVSPTDSLMFPATITCGSVSRLLLVSVAQNNSTGNVEQIDVRLGSLTADPIADTYTMYAGSAFPVYATPRDLSPAMDLTGSVTCGWMQTTGALVISPMIGNVVNITPSLGFSKLFVTCGGRTRELDITVIPPIG